MAFNGGKLYNEAKKYYTTWFNPPPSSHLGGGYTNRFVEACRASAYWAGHIDMVVHTVSFVGVVVLIAWLVWR